MIRALLFDLDNTLIPEAEGWNAAFRAACGPVAVEMGLEQSDLRDAVFGAAGALWATSVHSAFCHDLGLGSPSSLSTSCPGADSRFEEIRAWLPSFRYQSWHESLHALGVADDDDLVLRLSARFMEECLKHHNPYPGVPGLLRRLHHDYRLAVVTNGFSDLQRQKLAYSGLDAALDATLISGELGFGKPDPRLFEAALDRLNVGREDALVIGDSAERDIAGAIKAGIRCVWLSREQDNSVVPANVPRIASLEELTDLLS